MTPDQLTTAALAWLGIKATARNEGQADYDAAQLVAPAVVSWINRLPGLRTVEDPETESGIKWAPDVELGAVMLTARLIRRRNSPAGIEAFTTEGATYVSRHDPDLARLLRLRLPMVG